MNSERFWQLSLGTMVLSLATVSVATVVDVVDRYRSRHRKEEEKK